MKHFKAELNNVEIEGLIIMFNKFMETYHDCEELPKYGFFYSSDTLNSEDSANGYPIEFEGFRVQSLAMGINGLTYVICDNEEEEEAIFEFNCYNDECYKIEKD